MGHSSKKKKRNKGGRGRAPSKGQSPGDDQDLLSEELTALAAIFQEDLKVVLKPPYTELAINLRPYSNDMGFEDLNISALLLVRLRIAPEKGLSKKDADRLISLLLDQANIYAREGRIMIFNLVEAAREFLSEVVPVEQPLKSGTCLGANRKDESAPKNAAVQLDVCYHSEEPFVYSSIDLYSDLCRDNATWGSHDTKVANENSSKIFRAQTGLIKKGKNKNILLQSHTLANLESVSTDRSIFKNMTPEALHSTKHGATPQVVTKLNFVAEETETDSKGSSPKAYDQQSVLDSSEKGSDSTQHEAADLVDQIRKVDGCNSEGESPTSLSFVSTKDDIESQSKKKELLLVHLLQLVCSSKRSPATALPEISSELYNLGVLSEWARDLVAVPPLVFAKAFDRAFEQHMTSSQFSQFWKPDISCSGDNASSRPNSRYLNDFEEVCSLGHGGFGHVALCKNKLDGRQYAVKRIRLKDKNPYVNEKILREVATLSRLQHQHVVRYYQAWVETEYGNYDGDTAWGSITAESSTSSYMGVKSTNATDDNRLELTYLYIQMEYCPRTLRQDFESYSSSFEKDYTWSLFRQIVEGLAHIHSQGIIHRDLTPSNIFFDVRNDIKIGDFGLAKFLKLEQLDHDQYFPTETTGVSMDGTSQVGTYFYTAPEIEQRWPQINEKVDMYSLGVIFFELWHPFATAMERHIVLSELKQKGLLPPSWVAKFPHESTLLRRLMSPSPSDRPSATELLQRELPPRMEDEWLNDMLRTIQTQEHTYVYDRVVSTIFDEERLITKSHCQHDDNAKMTKNEPSFIQYTESDLELRDIVTEACKEMFKQHCAKRMEISPMCVFDGCYPSDRRNTVKLLTQGGNMLELCHELRSPFVNWIIANQKLSFKRYEISWVYRRAIGHSAPNRFLQGDFDIIGGASPLTEAEVIKSCGFGCLNHTCEKCQVAMDIATRFFHPNAVDIRLNHGQVLESIWSWVGIASELRQKVAELLSLITSSCPQSTNRKSNWVFVRRQLLQDLNLSETIVDRLQTADLRFCGSADHALARLRGALSSDKFTSKALEELSVLLRCLRVWSIEQQVSIDVLMPPTEVYYRELFFQMYLKESNPGSVSERILLAVGGRYDHLINQMWDHEYKSTPPGAVGVSVALEKILNHSSVEIRPFRAESSTNVLVCSRGGGGLLQERMALVAELWQANIKAEFVPQADPSLKEQYDYASEHDIKCLVIITEAGLPETGLVKVRHLDLKKEKEVTRADIVKFLGDVTTRPRDLTTWT
ncbi:eIF-2-alpha kinase GCN2 isoform X4 [Phoenix dactylifera]|uniref:non-specific serine/threonine protein kinase n=1 Tax=Phoenix dactylifera TaxID=42345 RepID=A0A8B9AKB3_PHODC|nr:eIF-2-alpha kinase GCN2 isoform X4 [Phoenix dactylifera]